MNSYLHICMNCINKWSSKVKNETCPKCGSDKVETILEKERDFAKNWTSAKEYREKVFGKRNG